MSLPPLGGRPPGLPQQVTPLSGQRPGQRSSLTTDEERASRTERDANRRITQAEKEVEEARRNADQRIDQIKDNYEKRETEEVERAQDQLEKQRLKGYEQVRELQRAHQAELNRIRREGEREIRKLDDYYRNTLQAKESEGSRSTQAVESQHARELEILTRNRQEETRLATENHLRQTQELKSENEQKMESLVKNYRQEYDRTVAQTAEATEKSQEVFQNKYQERIAQNDQLLNDLNARASQAIEEIRRDTAQKLAAYSSRQSDPFYQLMELDSTLRDRGDHFELTVTIPTHEQKNVSVSIKGGNLVVSGARRNEERLDSESGGTRSTHSFQSYLESFPLSWPVDAKTLSREFDGDQLVVRVFKKGDFEYKSPIKEKPARVRAQRPHFPGNLPLAQADSARDSSQEASPSPGRPPGKRGGGTLS